MHYFYIERRRLQSGLIRIARPILARPQISEFPNFSSFGHFKKINRAQLGQWIQMFRTCSAMIDIIRTGPFAFGLGFGCKIQSNLYTTLYIALCTWHYSPTYKDVTRCMNNTWSKWFAINQFKCLGKWCTQVCASFNYSARQHGHTQMHACSLQVNRKAKSKCLQPLLYMQCIHQYSLSPMWNNFTEDLASLYFRLSSYLLPHSDAI